MRYIKEFEDYIPPRIGNGSQNFKPLGHDKFKIGDIVKSAHYLKKQLRGHSIIDYYKILRIDEDENEGTPYEVRDILNKSFSFWVNETDIVSTTPEEVEEFKIQQDANNYNL